MPRAMILVFLRPPFLVQMVNHDDMGVLCLRKELRHHQDVSWMREGGRLAGPFRDSFVRRTFKIVHAAIALFKCLHFLKKCESEAHRGERRKGGVFTGCTV